MVRSNRRSRRRSRTQRGGFFEGLFSWGATQSKEAKEKIEAAGTASVDAVTGGPEAIKERMAMGGVDPVYAHSPHSGGRRRRRRKSKRRKSKRRKSRRRKSKKRRKTKRKRRR